jgi:uncharacterized protein (DUF1697 family)
VPRYIAILRAINLGARNKISMADLRALFADLGAADVQTYVQSGNVVFTSALRSPPKLIEAIEARIRDGLGLDITVLVRTKEELEEVVEANPFLGDGRDATWLYVTFLAEAPDAARVRELEAMNFEPDECRVVGRHAYLHCPDGYGRSKLSNAFLERKLAVAATNRNWRTVTALAALART